MKRINWNSIGIALLFASSVLAEEAANRTAEELFVFRVLPVLKEKCFACHGKDPQELRGEFDMRSREAILRGGESEVAAVLPGDPENSPLVHAIRWDGMEMPPKENDRLSDEQIASIVRWIEKGAPWPDEARIAELQKSQSNNWDAADGVPVKTSGGLSESWTNRRYAPANLWAYQPLRKSAEEIDGENPIDWFIKQRLSELDIVPAPPADRRTLVRRVTFNLTGLPPSPEEAAGFVNDSGSDDDVYDALIERLLQSPHYGEHWGQHWLDVVRYADSSGYANDFERGSAWRYRDYVVRSFNEDKPYDQFVREQIAGDEIDSADPQLLIAAGFLRMGPWELTGMEVEKVARQRFLDDVTDAVGQVFLGHMLQCARCHDHKFDPVPTRDYYAMQAIFATTQFAEREAEFLEAENKIGFDERKYLEKRRAFYKQVQHQVDKKETLDAARDWYREQKLDTSDFEEIVTELTGGNTKPTLSAVRKEMAKRGISPEVIPPKKSGFEPKDFGIERICRKEAQRLSWRLDRYQPYAFSVYSGATPKLKTVASPLRMPDPTNAGTLEETAILTGGDPFSPAQPVEPAVLSAVSLPQKVPTQATGRRAALADWITSKDNPLTARVIVNRIWQWHFGQPLAGNPNNFGTTGKKPTHPELLDFLAQMLIDEGWSIKAIHRLILTSEAYRRASDHPTPEKLAAADPGHTSYATFLARRLTAEEIRDAMLSCSGELNKTVGGIPVRPEMNMEAALQPRMVMGTFAEAWQPSPLPSQRHRRSIYALRIRGQRDPFLEVFNAPGAETSCEARDTSLVTPQVFAMFNSATSFDRALAMANRLLKEADDASDASAKELIIHQAFRLCYGRNAGTDEVSACLQHWKSMTKKHEKLTFDAPQYPTEVTRNAVEENTGEKFQYVEPLEMYEDFVPDLKPSDTDALTRGLAEVCLVLMNSNEFAYVY